MVAGNSGSTGDSGSAAVELILDASGSMLQRIDRELNMTLEVERVIHITLDWALRLAFVIALPAAVKCTSY